VAPSGPTSTIFTQRNAASSPSSASSVARAGATIKSSIESSADWARMHPMVRRTVS
jgi:hypothetical protein